LGLDPGDDLEAPGDGVAELALQRCRGSACRASGEFGSIGPSSRSGSAARVPSAERTPTLAGIPEGAPRLAGGSRQVAKRG
jgi:hypothetical protein